MNCKPGDLAIIVKSCAGNEGKIVRCVKYLGPLHWRLLDGGFEFKETWETDSLLVNVCGEKGSRVKDENLKPIGDPGEDTTDETLQWLPVPSNETAEA